MGFSGDVVFGRSDRPLLEAAVFDGLAPQTRSTVETWCTRPGGWQGLEFHYSVWKRAEAVLPGLVAGTGAPACFASFHDSDVAWVTGLAPGGISWDVCLNLDVAARLWAPEPDDIVDMSQRVTTPGFAEAARAKRAELDALVPEAARGALAWAEAAGFAPGADAAAVEDLLRSRETFAEDLFGRLLTCLGFPEAGAEG